MIKFIATHHTGGVASDIYRKSSDMTWQQVNEAHRQRWDFKSSLGYYGGYNFLIQADGTVKQFRAIGEETAAQIGHNFDTISICFTGNFLNGMDTLTEEQKNAGAKLILRMINKDFMGISVIPNTQIELSLSSVHPHRWYQSTECDCLNEAFWRDYISKWVLPPSIPPNASPSAVYGLIDMIISLLNELKEKIRLLFSNKVGGMDRACNGKTGIM